jgi:hypothetical protein
VPGETRAVCEGGKTVDRMRPSCVDFCVVLCVGLKAVLSTSDELLSNECADSWHDLRPHDRRRTASRLLRVVESSVFDYAGTLAHSQHRPAADSDGLALVNITDNIGLWKTPAYRFLTVVNNINHRLS